MKNFWTILVLVVNVVVALTGAHSARSRYISPSLAKKSTHSKYWIFITSHWETKSKGNAYEYISAHIKIDRFISWGFSFLPPWTRVPTAKCIKKTVTRRVEKLDFQFWDVQKWRHRLGKRASGGLAYFRAPFGTLRWLIKTKHSPGWEFEKECVVIFTYFTQLL